MWYIIAAVLAFFILVLIPPFITIYLMVKPKSEDYKRRIYMETMNGCLDEKFHDKVFKIPFTVDSTFGAKLYGEFLPNPKKTNRTIVIVHGHHSNLIVSLKYAEMFLRNGFNALVFDNEHCGKSTGKLETMGYHEREDLKIIIAKARELTGENAEISIHGESMGAAAALMYLQNDSDIKFIISDCSFANLQDELASNARNIYHMPRFPLIPLSSLYCKILFGYFLSEVSPLNSIRKNNGYQNTPIMFIHGQSDTTTPYKMCKQLYNAKKGVKKLYNPKYAQHARSFLYDKETYEKEVMDFIKSIE